MQRWILRERQERKRPAGLLFSQRPTLEFLESSQEFSSQTSNWVGVRDNVRYGRIDGCKKKIEGCFGLLCCILFFQLGQEVKRRLSPEFGACASVASISCELQEQGLQKVDEISESTELFLGVRELSF